MGVLLAWLGVVLFVGGAWWVITHQIWDLHAMLRHPAWLAFLVGAVLLFVTWLGLGVQPEDLVPS